MSDATQTTLTVPPGDSVDATIRDDVNHVVAEVMVSQVPKVAAAIAQNEIQRADARRQAIEDKRANRRNRNRSYTLVVALIFTFMVPYLVANVLHDAPLLKYAIGIAIIPDAFITLYAWIRHY